MRVLFLASCSQRGGLYDNASVRYRCYNPAEDLNVQGVLADVCHVDEFRKELIDHYDAFIFHRPTDERDCIKVIRLLRGHNKVIIADYDDLLFGKENALHSPAYINEGASKRLVLSANQSYTKALLNFDYFTVSTEPLADHIRKIKPAAVCRVVHNGINQRWFDIAGRCRVTKGETIGYFAGGSCHNKDFLSISSLLKQSLLENKSCKLLIPEMLSIPDSLKSNDQISTFGKKHFFLLPEVMANCSVNIAPLLDNEFNRCKSAIKFLESATAGVPLVASAIPDFMRFSSAGLTFAYSHIEWKEHIEEFLSSGSCMKKELREYVFSYGMSNIQSMKLCEFISGLVNG